MPKKFKIGKLTEDDLDQDYEPGRADKTMSPAHKRSLDDMIEQIGARADEIARKRNRVVIVLEPEK